MLKQDSLNLIDYMFKVYEKDHSIFNTKSISWRDQDDEKTIREILEDFREWAKVEKGAKYPKFFSEVSSKEGGQYLLNTFFMCLEAYLIQMLKLDVKPSIVFSSYDTALHENNIKWQQHVGYPVIDLIDEHFLELLSQQDTIVVVADIRNSQDLITYSSNPDIYKKHIMELVNGSRAIVTHNCGIFDRFTGDGFICYFNKYICNQFHYSYLKAALVACNEIIKLSNTVFQKWVKHIRKLPSDDVGLSIGLDSGLLAFSEVDNHFFAIGTPCVWATRACDIGEAGDIVLNNIVFHQFLQKYPNIATKKICSTTKSGESFQVHKIENQWITEILKRPK